MVMFTHLTTSLMFNNRSKAVFLYNKMGSFIYFLPISSNKMCEAPAKHIVLAFLVKCKLFKDYEEAEIVYF